MLEEKLGNLFESNAQTLVNTVNCEGYMGKGLALEVKKRYPEVDKPYKAACDDGSLTPGVVQLVTTPARWIINFPTKDRWRAKSRLTYVESGLEYFKAHYKSWGVKSVAFPQLGCGLGGLEWQDVRPLMMEHLSDLDISVEVWVQPAFEQESNLATRHRTGKRPRRAAQKRLL